VSSPERIRAQIDEVVKKRAEAERRRADALSKQAKKASEAASYRAKAEKASSASMARSYLRQAETAEKAALSEGNKAAEESKKIAGYAKKEAELSKALSAAINKEGADQERARKRQAEQDARARKRLDEATRRAERARTESLISATESRLSSEIAQLRPPKVERLRILYVTAASEGDLRVDKEIRRVRKGVKAATLRELVEIEHLSAATPSDFLDGMSGFKPHVVHFSGHANADVLAFDTDDDHGNPGQEVSASLFARAVGAVDAPPLLVVLNACHSEAHLTRLLDVVPMAIGMSDEIGDADAMSFAARFYTAIADGQSVSSAFEAARVQMEFDGMPDADLPVLRVRQGIDPADAPLVIPPSLEPNSPTR
jgi:CHAT domain